MLDRVLDELAVGGLQAERRRPLGVATLVRLAGTTTAHPQRDHVALIPGDRAEHLPDECSTRVVRPERAVRYGANSSAGTRSNSTMCRPSIATPSHRSNCMCCPEAPTLT